MKTKKRSSFAKITDEIRVMILYYCPLQSVFRFAWTCKKNFRLVKNSSSLQLRIELEANGLELIGKIRKESSDQQVLDELIRYRDAWLDFDIRSPVVRPVKEQGMKCWQLYEGHWFVGFSDTGDKPDLLRTVNLDSSTLPPNVDFRTQYDQFTVDLSQELVVFLASSQEESHIFHIHLRSSTTGGPHPSACLPTLTAVLSEPFGAELSNGNLRLRLGPKLMGKTLVTSVESPLEWSTYVLVWDWIAGTLLGHIQSEGFFSAEFLDNRHLVIYHTFPVQPDSEYAHDSESDHEGSQDSEFNDESDQGSESNDESSQGSAKRKMRWEICLLIHVIPETRSYHRVSYGGRFDVFYSDQLCQTLFFKFPRLDSAFDIVPHRTLLRSGPTPGSVIFDSHSARFALSRVPILGLTLCLSQRRYFGTTFRTEGAHVEDVYYRIFVDTDRLLKYMPIDERQRTVRWNEWGEHSTRWFREDPESFDYRWYWDACASGSRFIKSNLINDDAQALSIYDFDPLIVKRHLDRSQPYYIKASRSPYDRKNNLEAVRRGEGLLVRKLSYNTRIDEMPPSQPSKGVFVDFVTNDQPTVIHKGFQEPFQSHLAYRSVTKVSSVIPSGGWFVDGCRIISIHEWADTPWEFSVYNLNVSNDVIDLSDDD